MPKILCLIDCDRPVHELRKRYLLFWNYLQTGKEHGIHEGYLASCRAPWYAQEKRVPAPFLCTCMGRTSNGRKPFRFLWNQSAALASNLYLLLFPKRPLQAALRADRQLFPAVFQVLRQIDTDAFLREGRVFGGLYKMEAKELGRDAWLQRRSWIDRFADLIEQSLLLRALFFCVMLLIATE